MLLEYGHWISQRERPGTVQNGISTLQCAPRAIYVCQEEEEEEGTEVTITKKELFFLYIFVNVMLFLNK